MGKARRKHYKIETFPREIVDAINKKLVDGYTYEEVAAWLNELGHNIGKSSVGRYGKDFLSRLERLKVVKEQAKAIIDVNPDAPATEMAEAANQLATQLIMEFLMQVDLSDMEEAKVTEVLKALSHLERSGVQREKLKFDYNRGVEAAAEKIKENLRNELAANQELQQKIFALVDQAKEQVAK